jgi:uncharacterized protein DUF6923
MKHKRQLQHRVLILVAASFLLIAISSRMRADSGMCGGTLITLPFTDVQSGNIFFCAIAEAYFSGLTNGTSSTTYNPSDPVPREQMAAFITRTMDQSLRRGSPRSALDQWWTPTDIGALRAVTFNPGSILHDIICDGQDLWIGDESGVVFRVHASDGKLLGTWTGATGARGPVAAAGRIFIAASTGNATPGKIYAINPEAAPGPVTVFENDIGANPYAMAFDGANLWTANLSGSISRVNVGTGIDSTFTGFGTPVNIIWDGANLWLNDGQIKRIDPSNGTVLQTIPISGVANMRFDGANLWMSLHNTNNLMIMRAVGPLRATVLATLTGNGLQGPYGMAFDGERMLVCNNDGNSVSLFKAADFTALGNVYTGDLSDPRFACNDGVNFWVIRYGKRDIVRF